MASEQDPLQRLLWDTPYFAEHCLRIVTKAGAREQLVPRPAQLRFDQALEAQRAAGKPMRALVLKARQLGISTWVQAKMLQRVTQHKHRSALVLAHDRETGRKLFEMAEGMWRNLPDPMRPYVSSRAKGQRLEFNAPSREAERRGDYGLESWLEVGTAGEYQSGRGATLRLLHGSEVAFWPAAKTKLTGLMQTVPDEPETLAVLESTANGSNYFKTLWDLHYGNPDSDFVAFFAGWHEDPAYAREFASEGERDRFEDQLGRGKYGEDEPALLELGLSWEQLHWRRWAIVNKCGGDLDVFHQEYPALPEEAFLASGRKFFPVSHITKALRGCVDPQHGALVVPDVGGWRTVQTRHGQVEVAQKAEWKPRQENAGMAKDQAAWWDVWQHPMPAASIDELEAWCKAGTLLEDDLEALRSHASKEGVVPAGQYIVSMDPAGDEQDELGKTAEHAIQVIDHRTRRQVAEWSARTDQGVALHQWYFAALYWNRAMLVVETTGGYGMSAARVVFWDYRYPFVYRRKRVGGVSEKTQDRLGWDTNRERKVLIEDGAKELLRTGSSGIRSAKLGGQMLTYVVDEKGRRGPEPGQLSDKLMAWMIGQEIAERTPLRRERSAVTSTAGRARRRAVPSGDWRKMRA